MMHIRRGVDSIPELELTGSSKSEISYLKKKWNWN